MEIMETGLVEWWTIQEDATPKPERNQRSGNGVVYRMAAVAAGPGHAHYLDGFP